MRINNIFTFKTNACNIQKCTKSQVQTFGNSKSLISKGVKELVSKDAKQPQPWFISIKNDFLENFIDKVAKNKDTFFIVSVAGESASGKSATVENGAEAISKYSSPCTIINADDYLRDMSKERVSAGGFAKLIEDGYSFDVPCAIDTPLLKSHLIALKNGISIKSPRHEFLTSASIPNSKPKNPSHIILHEGLWALNKEFDNVSDAKIYVKAPSDVIKKRWFERATSRGITSDETTKFFKHVTDKAQIHVHPQEEHADIVLNGQTDLDYQDEVIKRLIDIAN